MMDDNPCEAAERPGIPSAAILATVIPSFATVVTAFESFLAVFPKEPNTKPLYSSFTRLLIAATLSSFFTVVQLLGDFFHQVRFSAPPRSCEQERAGQFVPIDIIKDFFSDIHYAFPSSNDPLIRIGQMSLIWAFNCSLISRRRI